MASKLRRVDRRSAAGASTPPLPPSSDVVFEILSWLPPRSLSRSRCVCTSWRALISDPSFLAVHRSRAEPLFVAASYFGRGKSARTTLQIMAAEGHVARFVNIGGLWTFRASVDRIVLLTSRDNDNSPAIRVVDLAAGVTIASFPRPAGASDHVWFGFGHAARSGVLKVIRIVYHVLSDGDHHTCEVLTLADVGGSKWRRMGSPRPMSYYCNDGVALNGVVHFLSMDDILCFDLEGEEWTTMHGPPRVPTTWENIGLAELNATLCISHGKRDMVDLWLLTGLRNKEVWVMAYTISVDIVYFVPLRVMQPSGKLIFYDRRDYMPRSTAVLHVYDPRSGKCTNVEKAPTNIVGRIGLCSSHLDSRLYG